MPTTMFSEKDSSPDEEVGSGKDGEQRHTFRTPVTKEDVDEEIGQRMMTENCLSANDEENGT